MKAEKKVDEFNETLDSLEQENKILRETIFQLRMELDRFRSPALMLAETIEVNDNTAIIKVPNGNKFLVNIANNVKKLKPGDSVTVEQKNLTVVDVVTQERNLDVDQFVIIEKPNIRWKDIGGLKSQEQELKEVVELPLKNPKLFKDIGISPPKGILLYGPPGTGKTLLAKAVANSTDSTFIEIVGSELVQKFIGEGAKLVKEIFKLAKQKAPTIIFIDEIDAIASKRIEVGTSGEREVQRTFMQLLAELDGFEPLDNVKVVGCTNRKDILDTAVIRPGRLDRLIEVPAPNEEGLREIFKIHSKKMTLDKKVDLDTLFKQMEGFTGAEIKSVCTEAGYFAIRNKRTGITHKDFVEAVKKIKKKEEDTGYKAMFG
ncbi:MAG: proteasome-activating nucleotidase [Candidatus Woesearchaeota archaeon]